MTASGANETTAARRAAVSKRLHTTGSAPRRAGWPPSPARSRCRRPRDQPRRAAARAAPRARLVAQPGRPSLRRDDFREPGANCARHSVGIGSQAMVAPHLHHSAEVALRWDAEPVTVALHDEHRIRTPRLEQAALRRLAPGTARRLEREGEAENADRPDGLGRATGDAGPERPRRRPRAAGPRARVRGVGRSPPSTRCRADAQARVTAAPRRDTAARP